MGEPKQISAPARKRKKGGGGQVVDQEDICFLARKVAQEEMQISELFFPGGVARNRSWGVRKHHVSALRREKGKEGPTIISVVYSVYAGPPPPACLPGEPQKTHPPSQKENPSLKRRLPQRKNHVPSGGALVLEKKRSLKKNTEQTCKTPTPPGAVRQLRSQAAPVRKEKKRRGGGSAPRQCLLPNRRGGGENNPLIEVAYTHQKGGERKGPGFA